MKSFKEYSQAVQESPEEKASPEALFELAQSLRDLWQDQPDVHLVSGKSYETESMTPEQRQKLEVQLLNKRRAAWFANVVNCAEEAADSYVSNQALQEEIKRRASALFDKTFAEHEAKQDMTTEDVKAGDELLTIVIHALRRSLPTPSAPL